MSIETEAREWICDAFDRIGERAFELPIERVWAIIDAQYDGGRGAFLAALV